MKYKYKGKVYPIRKSSRKNKQFQVTVDGNVIHFADPKMPEYPGTKRGNSYCARSYGIKGRNNINSANFWSRQLWSCKGKKSIKNKKFFGKLQ